ncbi:MAG TPA: PAS domain-containing sensor histidine kinase [Ktedonobacteraceae bacterium]|jgi:hypothetical protein|nr:PAS domain-containing sensor histidine kinase [Ktedonobacteraceae bacterium]
MPASNQDFHQDESGQLSQAQMQFAIEASGVGMWDRNLHTGQLVWTYGCKALFGWPSDAPVSYARFLAAVHPNDREQVDYITKQCLSNHTEFRIDYRTIWPDGSIHWLTDRARGFYDAQGNAAYLIGATMDITDQKQAEEALRESETRFRRLVESNLIGITVGDLEGNICEANESFLSLVGYTQDDLSAGRVQWTTMTPPEYRVRDAQAVEELQTTGVAQPFEKEHITKDGKRVPVLWGGARIHREDPAPLTISFIVDLTAQKESARQKDLFLGMTSHELKTPLTSLKGTLQLIEKRAKHLTRSADHLPPEMDAFLKELAKNLAASVRQVNMQTHLINDLLDVSRIMAGTLELSLQRSDLVSVVRETVDDLRVTAPERSLQLELPSQAMITVLVDRERIGQVVTNYITNGLRYSDPTQPVYIGLTLQGEKVRVWVRDKGPGLSEETQQKIWQCFHQVKEVPVLSGSEKGLGLGLFISQMLIAQHQGEVGVESTPGEGSTFWFSLPLAK